MIKPTDRRSILLGASAIAIATALGTGPADAQFWRFLRSVPRRYTPRGNRGGVSPRPTCPPHNFVLYGTDPRTGRYVMRCMKCGLFKIN